MAYASHGHGGRQTDQHVAQFYDLIIDRVVEELTPKLEDEGIDTSVLQSIKQVRNWDRSIARYKSCALLCLQRYGFALFEEFLDLTFLFYAHSCGGKSFKHHMTSIWAVAALPGVENIAVEGCRCVVPGSLLIITMSVLRTCTNTVRRALQCPDIHSLTAQRSSCTMFVCNNQMAVRVMTSPQRRILLP